MILSKIKGISSEGEVPVFLDLYSIPTYAREGVYAAYRLGIIDAVDGKIDGARKLTRAECAEYIYRAISR